MKVVLQNLTKKFPGRNKHVREEAMSISDLIVVMKEGVNPHITAVTAAE